MTSPPRIKDRQLEVLYAGTSQRVAFVDEAYKLAKGGRNFYILSAVIVDVQDVDGVRWDLQQRVPDGYWHTTEALKSDAGQAQALSLLDYLATSGATLLCVIEADLAQFSDNLEMARRHCFEGLAQELIKGHDVELIVYERRRAGVEEDNDRKTASLLQNYYDSDGLKFHGGTPSSEPLLWAPDLVAGALRRRSALRDLQWFEPIKTKTRVVRASDLSLVKLE